MRDALHGLRARFRLRVEMLGQTVDLLDIKDGVALHEGDGAFASSPFGVRLGADDLVGIDDKAALFALADMRLQFKACLKVIQIGAA